MFRPTRRLPVAAPFRASAVPILVFAAVAALAPVLRAQDDLELGKMWTFENPPLDHLEAEYGFRPTQDWLDRVRLASLRFGAGCSAAFVSPHGLIMTNQHCVRDDIANAQGANDWVENGYVATTAEDEVRLPGLTVQQLVSMVDVTAAMNQGVGPDDSHELVQRKREANRGRVLAAAQSANPEQRAEVVELFQGAEYQLYSYEIYDDVRLVVAPHLQTAHFGGDFDNFTYPRFGIDFAFCRAYVDGKPADTRAHYFRWSRRGAREGELVFVTGNPGSTERLLTRVQLEYQRDGYYPWVRQLIDSRLRILRSFAAQSEELQKELRTDILRFENAQKAFGGEHEALRDPAFMARKAAAERRFRARVAADPKARAAYRHVWDELAAVAEAQKALEGRLRFQVSGGSQHLDRALAVVRTVRGADGVPDPLDMPTAPSPMQRAFFVDHLARMTAWLSPDDPYRSAVLRGRGPAEAAQWLEANTRIGDDAFVSELLSGGAAAVRASDDPAIEIARVLDPLTERNRAAAAELEARAEVLGTELGLALFAVYGRKVSPDATFTLRLSDGRVRGYPCNGTRAPYRTVFHGLYARHASFDGEHPFDLPEVWLERKDRIDMTAAVNFVCTVDSTGGNSGSPVIDKDMEIVGVLFDGNIESLANQFLYDEDTERSVCVHVHGIVEAVRKIYDAERVLQELLGDSDD